MLRPRLGNFVTASALFLGTVSASGALLGCRVGDTDVHRWGTTEHGPDKLVAVVTHDKYEWALRNEAAVELIRMKPRNGRRLGIGRVVDALSGMSPAERAKLMETLIPAILAEMKKPPPPAQANQPAPPDPSVPYKDAAFALWSAEKTLIADDAQRKLVTDALVDWCTADFEHRIDNSAQMYGLEQVMRQLGAPSVKSLPKLVTQESTKNERIASLVAELGDGPTKEATATQFVALAKYTVSQQWWDKKKPQVEEANNISKLKVTPAQLQAQVAQYQDEELTRVFGALKKVGSRPAIDFCLGFGADAKQSEKRRQAAVAALEGRLDRNNPKDVQGILGIATADDTPDSVRDLAFARVGEMPREQVVGKLYDLFTHKKWKVRLVAAQTVLKMSNTSHLPEFMSKLPSGSAPGFGMSEPLYYGGQIAKLPGKDPKEKDAGRNAIMPFLREGSLAAHLTALGFFYQAGKPADLALLAPFEAEKTAVPKVEDPEAKWQCEVPKAANPKENEMKQISTVGEFVQFCVKPNVAKGSS